MDYKLQDLPLSCKEPEKSSIKSMVNKFLSCADSDPGLRPLRCHGDPYCSKFAILLASSPWSAHVHGRSRYIVSCALKKAADNDLPTSQPQCSTVTN